jgi:hypothetical protein
MRHALSLSGTGFFEETFARPVSSFIYALKFVALLFDFAVFFAA